MTMTTTANKVRVMKQKLKPRGAAAVLLLSALVMVGCSSAPKATPKPVYVEAAPTPAPAPPVPKVVAVPVAQPLPGQLRPQPVPQALTQEQMDKARAEAKEPWRVIDEANNQARSAPIPDGYFNAIQTYDFAPGALYQIYTAPLKLTTLTFAPGEKVLSYAAGDTVRWVVDETISGVGDKAQTHLLIKPVRAGLHTTMVVTTNLALYQLELHSYRDSFMAAVSFNYPTRMVRELEHELAQAQSQTEREARSQASALGVDASKLEFRYGFVVSDRDAPPRWLPERVYHDGSKTYIEFDQSFSKGRAPALFVLSRTSRTERVEYRIESERIYVVDEVIERAILRLGTEDDETVGIELLPEAQLALSNRKPKGGAR